MADKRQPFLICTILFATCLLLFPHGALVQETESSPPPSQEEQTANAVDSKKPPQSHPAPSNTEGETIETEVVAFQLRGKSARERFEILDLDTVLLPEGNRYFPLSRLLQGLQLDWTRENGLIVFQPEGGSTVTIDLNRKEIEINGQKMSVDLLVAVSDITMKEDIFLLPEVIAQIFTFTLTWDDASYSFQATTEKLLSIWKRPEWVSLLGIKTEEILQTLPAIHPPALPDPRKLSLDFLVVEGRATYRSVDPNNSNSIKVDTLKETLYGGLARGSYTMEIAQPYLTYDDAGFDSSDDPLLMVKWADWRRYFNDNIMAVAGDSRFGLSDLSFPSVRISGLRVNGLLGLNETTKAKDRSKLGLNDVFTGPQVFEGVAPVDSRVELFLNDQFIEGDVVASSLPSQPGTGAYRFDNITLTPGTLNKIRIIITDPNGVETVIEKTILESTGFLSKGGVAFLAGAGTNRDQYEWDAQGLLSGGRLFYGLGRRLTVGASIGYQDDFFEPVIFDVDDPDERQYPATSLHAGGQFAWQPFNSSIVLGDFAWVQGDEADKTTSFDDFSVKLNGLYNNPFAKTDLSGLYFRYGPDFFDGNSRNLRDRAGYVINGHAVPHPMWRFQAAGSQIWDNLDSKLNETRSVNLVNIGLSTLFIPFSTWTFAYNRIAPDWDESPHTLLSAGLRSSSFYGWGFNGLYATGDNLRLNKYSDFLDGLRLPGIVLSESEKISAQLHKRLPWSGNLALNYLESGSTKRISFIHTDTFKWRLPIDIRTEAGYDIDTETIYFENRTEIPVSKKHPRSRLGLLVRTEKDEWRVEVYINIAELFSFLGGRPSNVSKRRINPEGKVVRGKVFLDRNANGVLDQNEQGIEEIKVLLNNRREMMTDSRGNFFFSTSAINERGMVNLDPNSIPAIYSCTHGRQEVHIKDREITSVNFGLAPVNYVSGYIIAKSGDDEPTPLAGIRVFVKLLDSDEKVAESITAGDGSYYLEDIRPGKYVLMVDQESVPVGFIIQETSQPLTIEPADESQEIAPDDIIAIPADTEKPTEDFKELPLPLEMTPPY